jgi:hypothetical protein
VILNAHTDNHPMRYAGRRARKVAPERRQPAPAAVDGLKPNPNGSLAERCAWMKQRQTRKRPRQTSREQRQAKAEFRAIRQAMSCGVDDYAG